MTQVTHFAFGIRNGKPMSEYDLLIAQLADEQLEPRYGYLDAQDIRALTDDEISAVCTARDIDVLDNLNLSAADLARSFRDPVARARIAFALEEACRHVILLDLQAECAARDQAYEWENAR